MDLSYSHEGIDSTAGEYTGARSQVRDPGGETILEIREALGQINLAAAEEFIRLYLEMPKMKDSCRN